MNILKMDLADVVSALKAKDSAGKGNPHLKSILLGVALIVILATYLFFVYFPGQQRLKEQRFKVAQIDGLRQEIIVLQQSLAQEEANLKAANQRYRELSRLFHTEQEFEDLYSKITTIAFTKGLTISSLAKGAELAAAETPSTADEDLSGTDANGIDPVENSEPLFDEMGNEIEQKPKIAFYKIPMIIEITGPYLRYVEFRKSLAELPKLINIDQESIELVEDSQGAVKINAVLSTFKMPQGANQRKEVL